MDKKKKNYAITTKDRFGEKTKEIKESSIFDSLIEFMAQNGKMDAIIKVELIKEAPIKEEEPETVEKIKDYRIINTCKLHVTNDSGKCINCGKQIF